MPLMFNLTYFISFLTLLRGYKISLYRTRRLLPTMRLMLYLWDNFYSEDDTLLNYDMDMTAH